MSIVRGSSSMQRANVAPAGNQATRIPSRAQAKPETLVFSFTDRDVSELTAVALFFRTSGRILKAQAAEELAMTVQAYLLAKGDVDGSELGDTPSYMFGLNDVGALLSWRKFRSEMPASSFQYCRELAGRLFATLTGDPLPVGMEGR